MPKFVRVLPHPGDRIDFAHPGGPVVRNAAGDIIATDLRISKADFEALKARFLEQFGVPPKE